MASQVLTCHVWPVVPVLEGAVLEAGDAAVNKADQIAPYILNGEERQ